MATAHRIIAALLLLVALARDDEGSLDVDPLEVSKADASAATAEATADSDPDAGAGDDAESAVKSVLSQVTIAMASDVVDERTFKVRRSGAPLLTVRLGNTAPLEKGSLSDEEHQAKRQAAQAALAKHVRMQMVLWKAAPDEAQPPQSEDGAVTIADVWTTSGLHIPSLLRDEGHLAPAEEYKSEWSEDILSAKRDKEKAESFKQLDAALKEEAELRKKEKELRRKQRQLEREQRRKAEEAEEASEPWTFGELVGLACLALLIFGAAFNFGRPKKAKINYNKKRSLVERFLMKVKGS